MLVLSRFSFRKFWRAEASFTVIVREVVAPAYRPSSLLVAIVTLLLPARFAVGLRLIPKLKRFVDFDLL